MSSCASSVCEDDSDLYSVSSSDDDTAFFRECASYYNIHGASSREMYGRYTQEDVASAMHFGSANFGPGAERQVLDDEACAGLNATGSCVASSLMSMLMVFMDTVLTISGLSSTASPQHTKLLSMRQRTERAIVVELLLVLHIQQAGSLGRGSGKA